MDSYAFDAAWEKERDRLRALEAVFDQATTRRLADIGVGAGWRCLEVGCGAGGVALWLAGRVGLAGRVLATDLDTRFVAGHEPANLDVQTHDITADAIEPGGFDLVHTRNVLAHLRDRRAALDRMIGAVRPGGWILIEDTDMGEAMISALSRCVHPPEYASVVSHIYRALQAAFTALGADASIGPHLAGWLADAGLEHVGAEIHGPITAGGSEYWARGSIEQLADRLVATGLVTAADVQRYLSLAADPAFLYPTPILVSAWGQRPAGLPDRRHGHDVVRAHLLGNNPEAQQRRSARPARTPPNRPRLSQMRSNPADIDLISAVTPIAGHGGEGDRREPRPR